EYRRHALLAIVVIAAVITPPDVMSQMLVAVPMYFLYEASIWVSAAVLKTSSVETDLVESNELVSEK
ncbi:MAG TPA: twin-arginine translocase subunit TatC, partial [Chitinophagales bacterium]|nr:twin-arginine translocase subunit TatC [Chitinophagales bacterium]